MIDITCLMSLKRIMPCSCYFYAILQQLLFARTPPLLLCKISRSRPTALVYTIKRHSNVISCIAVNNHNLKSFKLK